MDNFAIKMQWASNMYTMLISFGTPRKKLQQLSLLLGWHEGMMIDVIKTKVSVLKEGHVSQIIEVGF